MSNTINQLTNETNPVYQYHVWLDSIDSRLRQIIVDADDEYVTGRIGSRSNFEGEIEFKLLTVAEGAQDFKNLYVTLRTFCGDDKQKAEHEATRLWNMSLHFLEFQLNKFVEALKA